MQIPIETYRTCDCSKGEVGVRTPYPPSGFAHAAHFPPEMKTIAVDWDVKHQTNSNIS